MARSTITSLLLLALSLPSISASQNIPIINTTSGPLLGFTPFPNVTAYLGIPYAQPPVGDLRFAAPVPYTTNDTSVRECYRSTPGCFQLNYLTAFSDRSTGVAESEDMMSINIWKPTKSNGSLPVMIFLYGGGFTSGANGLPEYDGTDFVAEQGDIIIASINYRVNIFGFPNTPALATKNVGLLDQRLGVEWLRDNIASFGGDEKRMVLAGHSAGSQSNAYWSYAYAEDPIVAGLIELSGQPGLIATDDGTSWQSIANSTGCDDEESSPGSQEELECMRSVPARSLKRAMSINNTPSFTDLVVNGGVPAVDNVTVFPLEEYTSRGIAGEFAKIPLLVSHTMNEADAVLPFSPLSGINQTESDLFTLAAFHCPVSHAANYTSSAGIPTYRYLYAGSFMETLSYPWLRPYHGSDLELVFKKGREDAYQDFDGEIKKAGRYLRDAIAAFVRDPEEGLVGFGWPRYETGAPTLVKLFGNSSAAVTFEDPATYDAPCQYL